MILQMGRPCTIHGSRSFEHRVFCATDMKAVSRFEANLLRILHGVLGRAPAEQVVPLVQKRLPRPKCLRREAVELVQDALGKGTVWILAREGWRRERFLRGGTVRDGRLWQRTPPVE